VALKAGWHTLKITIQKNDKEVAITLEGRIAGPWVAELSRVWLETAPQLGQRTSSLDLRDVTYADAAGKQILRDIYDQSLAEITTASPWSQYLAEEIRKAPNEEVDNGNHTS
jgi:anti-anti-sigma regulatory factor